MNGYFKIDGKEVAFHDGQSVLEAARVAGIYIPHLCYHPEFGPHGSCRVCLVRAGGRISAACELPAGEGLVVESESADLIAMRREVVEMLFVEGNHLCPACEKSGACQLQAVAYQLGMLAPEFVHLYPQRRIDASHPDILFDPNRCILCGLCVRASRSADQTSVFTIAGRGIDARVLIESPSGRLVDADIARDHRAAHVCPVGAIISKAAGYRVPIGQRLYDRGSIEQLGDLADHPEVQT